VPADLWLWKKEEAIGLDSGREHPHPLPCFLQEYDSMGV